jgi:hypothetical protein
VALDEGAAGPNTSRGSFAVWLRERSFIAAIAGLERHPLSHPRGPAAAKRMPVPEVASHLKDFIQALAGALSA